MAYKLVVKDTGKEVKPGDEIRDFRGEVAKLISFRPGRINGKVVAQYLDRNLQTEYNDSVFGLTLIED